ncbi:hypothetical protein OG21DRAFT_1445453 [Imleria badia]|nr:hypothetical protein OG21DRAFT_1445453 [Imleria badia]
MQAAPCPLTLSLSLLHCVAHDYMVNNGREYRDPPIKIDVDGLASTMMFSVCGEYLLNGDAQGVQVLQAEGGKQVARMEAQYVRCLAQSKDGRWIAAGTTSGKLLVWDAETYETVFSQEGRSSIHGVDFSPDSSQLVVASWNSAASVWDIATRKEGLTLDHEYNTVIAAKYSPQGDRIATATDRTSVRVWNSSNGCLLVDINATVTPWNNTGLLWSKAHLFIVSRAKMTKIEASTGSVVSEWRVPDGNMPCLAPSQHGEYIAHAEKRTVTFLDTSTHTQLNFIRHSQNIVSIALSPDDRFLAIGGEVGKITIRRLSRVTAPVIQIYDEVLNSWKHDQLTNADESLTTDLSWSTFTTIQNSSHHILASRALVRARLRQWDEAMTDAKESIETLPSIIGYIAKSVVLLGKGERHKAYRACDIAFEHSPSTHVSFLLLIKAIIVFLAGEHDDAISRMDDLIDALHVKSTCYTVQAYMHFLLGNSRMESGDYTGAVRSFERAQAKMRTRTCEALSLVSMIFDWKFDNLTITIQCRLCEALCAAGHPKEAGEVVLQTVNTSGEEVYMSEDLTKWVSDFTQRCLATLGCKGDEVSKATQNDEPSTVDSTLGSPSPSPLLREWARAKLMYSPWKDALTAAVGFTASRFMIYRAICERLETIDHVLDVSECFLQMVNELGREISTHGEQATWAVAFWKGCTEKLERLGDAAADTQQHDDAIRSYSAALSVDFPIPHVFIKRSKVNMAMGLWENALHDANQAMALPSSPWNYENVLVEWTKVNLMDGLWKGALSAACDFKTPRIMIYRTLCEGLETVEGIMDAIECFHHMASELTEETIVQGDQAEWFRDFSYRCSEKLERIGDAAVDSQQPDEALKYYSAALSIHPANTQGVFILRSKVYMKKGLWEDALNDANEAITFDSSSPWGYETMRAVLHGTGRYDDAIQSFETMLVKMGQSADPQVRERCGQYVSPSTIQATIRKIVQRTIRHSPRVLINMTTGRLYNKTEQASAFMLLPIVNELVSSMTTRIDRGRIKREVRQFFRYVMLSHKWEENEPLFQQVIHIAVHDLDQSPTHKKLQMFCKIVRDAGFNWAWSDTCCIDKQDHFVLQEALVAMFKWYRGSALTIVYLRGVRSLSKLGDLVRSIWNTRAWTLQEYVASKVIRFYTEDWTPYLNVGALNHKESPEIISEMEQATEVSAQHLTALRPGLSSIRDKLRLASTRHTTLVEDAAYSLLGIFSVSGIPAIYGEGEGALGRLLAHILTGSGDASILAWTGQSGGYNSCLPAHITVFNQPASSHVPPHIEDAEMEDIITSLRGSAPDLELALKLYDRLNELPSPWFAASRMKLPSIAFKLPQLSPYRTRLDRVYRADTVAFGMVEIKTRQDPSRLNSLYLVHPWLDALLDREDMQSGAFVEDDVEEPSSPGTDDEEMSDAEGEDDLPPLSERGSPSTPPRMDTAPMDRETRALRLIARLRQPFGALLLTLTSTRRRSVVYRRVAADSTITVQLRESVPLSDLLDNVRILDVL